MHDEDALPCCHLADFHRVLLQTEASEFVLLGTGWEPSLGRGLWLLHGK